MGTHTRKLLLAATTAALLTACNLKHSGQAKPAVVLVTGLDASDSTDISKRCGEAIAQLRPLLGDRRLRRLDMIILGTGDNTTGGEPRLIVPWTTYVPTRGLYDAPEAVEKRRAKWLASVDAACRAAIRPRKASPVYELIDRSLKSIAARCLDLEHQGFTCSRKVLAVSSDLRSTYGAFGRYLKALAKRPRNPPPAPAPFDLGGIEAHVCGVSNTDAGDGIPAEVVLQAWQQAFGSSVAIDPTCASDSSAANAP